MSNTANSPNREHKNYIKLTRNPALNISKSEKSIIKKKKAIPKHGLGQFLDNSLFRMIKWFVKTTIHVFGWRKCEFRYYKDTLPDKGIYDMEGSDGKTVKIALTADWASDTDQSIKVADCMSALNPDYTIHLGDTYYVGNVEEIKDNFIRDNSPWQPGTHGSFAMLGNHEMYATGEPFFSTLLPQMGITDKNGNVTCPQKAAYFCLQTDHWRVIAIDTGYNSVNFLSFFGFTTEKCDLEKRLLDWLDTEVNLKDDKRGIIFLSHHQYCSAFSKKQYDLPGIRLKEHRCNRDVIWLFGHEHCFSAYSKYACANGISAWCRCIGNGGMPIELSVFKKINNSAVAQKNLVMFDGRKDKDASNDVGVDVGFNGYTTIEFSGPCATITYYDINEKLLEEKWLAGPDGKITPVANGVKQFEGALNLFNNRPISDITSS